MKNSLVIARSEAPIFEPKRFFRALLFALAMCGGLLAMLFVCLLFVFPAGPAAELTVWNARWLLPVCLCVIIPSLLLRRERRRLMRESPTTERKTP